MAKVTVELVGQRAKLVEGVASFCHSNPTGGDVSNDGIELRDELGSTLAWFNFGHIIAFQVEGKLKNSARWKAN